MSDLAQSLGRGIVGGVTDAGSASGARAITTARPWFLRGKERLRLAFVIVLLSVSVASSSTAGFLVGVGLDFVALADRWSVLSAAAFYWSILLAILSPVLAVPQSLLTAMRAYDRARKSYDDAAAGLKQVRSRIEKIRAELGINGPPPAAGGVATRVWTYVATVFRGDDHVALTADRRFVLEADLSEQKAKAAVLEQRLHRIPRLDFRSRAAAWVRRACYAFYGLLVFAAVLPLLTQVLGWIALVALLAVAGVVMLVIARDMDAASVIQIVTPALGALAFVCGLAMGQRAYALPLNTALDVDGIRRDVAIVLQSRRGYVVTEHTFGDKSNRQLAFIPRERVRSASISRPAWHGTGGWQHLQSWLNESLAIGGTTK